MELTIGTPEFNNYEEQFESRKAEWYPTENYRSETTNHEEGILRTKQKKLIKELGVKVKQTVSVFSGHHPPAEHRNDSLETLQMEHPISSYGQAMREYPEQNLATEILFSSATHMI